MQGITLREAAILQRALALYEQATCGCALEDCESDLDYITSLRQELRDFEELVRNGPTLELWTDGAARPSNPGPAGIGVVGKIRGRVVIEIAEHIGFTTNNVAEYMAAVTALRRAVDLGAKNVILRSDSKLVVFQFLGKWQTKDPSFVPLVGRMRGLAQRFDAFNIEWIPREENREADGLSVAGAYASRACGACAHAFHTSFCLAVDSDTPDGQACGCPYGFRKGLEV